jgi:hypothetical protein
MARLGEVHDHLWHRTSNFETKYSKGACVWWHPLPTTEPTAQLQQLYVSSGLCCGHILSMERVFRHLWCGSAGAEQNSCADDGKRGQNLPSAPRYSKVLASKQLRHRLHSLTLGPGWELYQGVRLRHSYVQTHYHQPGRGRWPAMPVTAHQIETMFRERM